MDTLLHRYYDYILHINKKKKKLIQRALILQNMLGFPLLYNTTGIPLNDFSWPLFLSKLKVDSSIFMMKVSSFTFVCFYNLLKMCQWFFRVTYSVETVFIVFMWLYGNMLILTVTLVISLSFQNYSSAGTSSSCLYE